MLWSVVVWIIATLFFAVCHPEMLQGSNMFKMRLHGLSLVLQSTLTFTSTLRTLHWLPVRQCIIFKTLVLVYKYLTTGQPKYFAPYLPLYKSAVNTRRSNPKNLFLLVPSYCPSIHKSKVHFNNSFSYDAPKLWNDFPYDIRSAPNLSSLKVDSKPTYFRNHSHHSFLLPNTGPPPWQRLGTCLMSHDLCLTDWMVCLRIRWYGD